MATISYLRGGDFDDHREWTRDLGPLEIRASRGVVADQQTAKDTNSKAESREHVLDIYMDMFLTDPIISTAIDTLVDVITRNGFRVLPKQGIKKSDKIIQKANEKLIAELDLDQVLDPLLYALFIYGSTYLEKRKKKGKVNELFSLEASEMAIKYNIHGKILGYVQRSGADGNSTIPFTTEEVIYIPLKKIGSKVESYEPLEPIAQTFATSMYAHNYMKDVFLNLPPKYLYTLTGGAPEQRKKLIRQIRLAKRDPTIDIVTQIQRDNALKVETLQPNFDDSLLKILEYAREQVLLVTRVPPVWVGLVNNDGANRGNSEAQIFSFETRIRKIQQKIESAFDKELLPAIGLKDFNFRFNAISLKNEKQIIENARQFKDMRLDDESVLTYLRSNGIQLRDGAKFEEFEDSSVKDIDLMQSRKREDKGTDDIKSNLDRTGVSEAGAKKAEQRD